MQLAIHYTQSFMICLNTSVCAPYPATSAIISCSKYFSAPTTTEVILLPITEYTLFLGLYVTLTPAISLVQWGEIAVLISHILNTNHTYNGYTVCFFIQLQCGFHPFFFYMEDHRPCARLLFLFNYSLLIILFIICFCCACFCFCRLSGAIFEIQMGRNSL